MSKSLRFGSALSAIAAGFGDRRLRRSAAGRAAPRSSAARSTSRTSALATRAAMALQANDFAGRDRIRRARGRKQPQRCRLPGLARQRLFRRGPLCFGRSGLSRFARAPVQPAAGRPEAGAGPDRPGQERRSAGLARRPRAMCSTRPTTALRWRLPASRSEAIAILEPAARQAGADARVRQNLALAYALTGDWTAARTVAAQDVPADQLDARIQQWMVLAKPARRVRPGRGADRRHAGGRRSGPADSPRARSGPTPHGRGSPRPSGSRAVAAGRSKPRRSRCRARKRRRRNVPRLQPAPVAPAPVRAAPVAGRRSFRRPAAVAASAPRSRLCRSGAAAACQGRSAAQGRRRAAAPRCRAPTAIDGGRPARRLRLAAACRRRPGTRLPRRHSALRAYSPMSARFNSPKGAGLSPVGQGLRLASEAKDLCLSLKRAGGSCFVRSVAGDAPVRIASR